VISEIAAPAPPERAPMPISSPRTQPFILAAIGFQSL